MVLANVEEDDWGYGGDFTISNGGEYTQAASIVRWDRERTTSIRGSSEVGSRKGRQHQRQQQSY